MIRALVKLSGSCLAVLSMLGMSQQTAQADVFEAFEPVSTFFGECCESLDLGGDTCCTGTCCDCCCVCPPAPTMIGDSLGIPTAVGDFVDVLLFPNFYSRVADNNSAIPQDRVYFNYKYINDVPVAKDIGANAPDQNRDLYYYELGLEKTFLEGNLSAEVIIPFAHMPESSYIQGQVGAPPSHVELLDIALGLKALLVETDTTALSAGFRVEAPTSERLQIPGLATVNTNDVWEVTPYLAVLSNLSDDTWFQAFAAYRMQTDDQAFVLLGAARALREPNYLQLDAQLGHWLYRDHGGSGLTGLQAKVELHYTGTFEPYEPRNTVVNGLVIGGGEHDVLNLTTGLTALINDNATITGAFVLPIREGSNANVINTRAFPSDRLFDWEFVAQFNYYFGN